uniref:Si:dkey-26c10.5 n=1 Tax=Neogobius melanostomus TaxID=47308 RepID=A0A8C6SHJ2_9GOBI
LLLRCRRVFITFCLVFIVFVVVMFCCFLHRFFIGLVLLFRHIFLWLLFIFLLCCQSNQCAPGWLQFGESCFFLSTLRKTWDEAKKNCSDMRGDLAVVTSPSVQKFLTGNGRLQYWIGLRGNTWVNGKSLSQSYWSDKPTPGYCVMLRGDMASDKNWYKSSCTRLTYYICERPVQIKKRLVRV